MNAGAEAFVLETADDTRELGRRLGSRLRAGDLLVLTGGLGAGKTTLTQGIADGLGVRGPITSPTFVIARVHPSLVGGPALVHVDAYRLGGLDELDALDLDESLDECITVVEWGHGLAEGLAQEYLEIILSGDEARELRLERHGERWALLDLPPSPRWAAVPKTELLALLDRQQHDPTLAADMTSIADGMTDELDDLG